MTAVYLMNVQNFLLLYREGGKAVNHVYTGSAGGHFEPHELNDPKACVLRELEEELGLTEERLEHLTLRYITLRKLEGEVRQNYYFFADLSDESEQNLFSNEGKLEWFNFEHALTLEMPLSAQYVLEHYVKTGRYNDKLYGGIVGNDGMVFTAM